MLDLIFLLDTDGTPISFGFPFASEGSVLLQDGPMTTGDVFIRRGGEEYTEAFAALLPRGPAWPRDPDSVLMSVVAGVAEIWGERVDGRAADILTRESDPRISVELLDEWERAFGLPDPCLAEVLTVADRQRLLIQRITMGGDPTPAFFVALAASIGYRIAIQEHSPFMAGISRAGDTRRSTDASQGYRWEVGPAWMRPYWTILVLEPRLAWFRAASGQAGIDPHLRIAVATDLECILRRFKPSHTQIAFNYSGLALDGAMTGTP